MTSYGWLTLASLAVLIISTPLLRNYMAKVYGNQPAPGDRFFLPIERFVYRVCRGPADLAAGDGRLGGNRPRDRRPAGRPRFDPRDATQALPVISADPGLLERALVNVLDNAREFAPPGVLARVEAGLAGGEHVEIRVIDQGPGVALDRRDQLFKPFQRLGDRPVPGSRGLGLGLAIPRGFVDAMGGELTLEDTPGGGATFVFSRPTADQAAPTPAPLASQQ